MLEKILKKLITFVYGLGFTILGTGLGGVFFSEAVKLGILMSVMGAIVLIVTLIIDLISGTTDGRGT